MADYDQLPAITLASELPLTVDRYTQTAIETHIWEGLKGFMDLVRQQLLKMNIAGQATEAQQRLAEKNVYEQCENAIRGALQAADIVTDKAGWGG